MKVECKHCGKKVHEQGLEDHYKSKRCWRARHSHLINTPGTTMTITCLCGCGKKKEVRKADFKRGWGMFFSKSCKARYQEINTGQYSAYKNGRGVSHAAVLRGESPASALAKYTPDTIDGGDVSGSYFVFTDEEHDEACASMEFGWDGHKDVF